MNCRESEALLLAEKDGALSPVHNAALKEHVASCPSCQRFGLELSGSTQAYRTVITTVTVPDATTAWRELQDRLARPATSRPLAPLLRFAVPLAAAAALVLTFFIDRTPAAGPTRAAPSSLETARADYVEAGDVNAATMVYVDKESGWLVVWATDTSANSSG